MVNHNIHSQFSITPSTPFCSCIGYVVVMKMDNEKRPSGGRFRACRRYGGAQLEQLDRPEDIEELRFRAGQPPAAENRRRSKPAPA